MTQTVDFFQLIEVARQMLAQPERQIMAISGAPGSGKSTIVEKICEELASDAVAILPMDGYHYDDVLLKQVGRHQWKGAPDTFDVGGLATTLRRLRNPEEKCVAVPVFDRDLEISRGSARIIDDTASLILAEGNYLLLDRTPWSGLEPFFDVTVMIDVPEEELSRRLKNRWVGFGLSDEQIAFKLDMNDMPNGRMVANYSREPDYRLAFAH